MKKITVIVPVYKSEQFLRKCVDSILNQTYTNLEVILVDDGSPDGCPAVCDLIAVKDSRVHVIHQKNAGVSAARNAGLRVATGDYFTFVDSDDYIEKEMYSAMMEIAQKHDCDVVMCDCMKEFPDHAELYTHDIRAGYYSKEQLVEEYYPHLLMMENVEYPPTISNWLCLCRHSQNDTFRLHYEEGIRYSEDLLFGAQMMRQADSFYYMKGQALYHYCMNPQSATHTYVPDKWEDYKKLHGRIKEEFWNDDCFDFRRQVDYCLLFFLYNAISDIYGLYELGSKAKMIQIKNILATEEVREMFRRIKVLALPISIKLKVVTWCYKYQCGIGALIRYYS